MNPKNKSDLSDLIHQAKKLQDTKILVPEKFMEDLLDKLKEAEAYKNLFTMLLIKCLKVRIIITS